MFAEVAEHAAGGASVWNEMLSILTDPAHVLAELTIEFGTGVVVYPFARYLWNRWQKRHDTEVHGVHDHCDHET